jgi:hypothetical protein
MSTTQDARSKFTIAKAQENLYSTSLGAVVGAVDTEKMGTVYNPFVTKPAFSEGSVSDSHATGAYVVDADSLQINRRADSSAQINSYDWKSLDFSLLANRSMEMGKGIAQIADAYFLSRPVGNVDKAFTAGDFGGSAGAAITIVEGTPSSGQANIDDVINAGLTQIHVANSTDKKFMAVSPFEANRLRQFLQATGNNIADKVLVNGIESGVTRVGTTFSGVDVYMTNNLTHEVVVTMATIPTAGQTLTINGVVITFVATLTGAGQVHIASTVDITRANLAEFLTGTNFPGDTSEVEATDTGYQALSVANRNKLSLIALTAVNDNGADTLTLTSRGTLVVTTNVTGATVATSRQCILGDYGSINMYLPSKGMDYTETKVEGKPGRELYLEQFHNSVVWSGMKDRCVTIKTS